MARLHRVATISAITTVIYLLCFFQVVTVPVLDTKISDQIVPVVRWNNYFPLSGSDGAVWFSSSPLMLVP